jgi:hypothetical protein
MMGDLYIRSDAKEDLEVFAARLFAVLNIPSFSIRESENFHGGRYFTARCLGLTVQLALGDDANLPEYNFWLTFSPPRELSGTADRSSLDGMADLLARKLALDGFDIARPLDAARVGKPVMFYRRQRDTAAEYGNQVEVWKA